MRGLLVGTEYFVMGVLLIGAVEKGRLLYHREARWHPLFVSTSRRRRLSNPLTALGLLSDVGALATLLVTPPVGAAIFLASMITYTAVGVPTMRLQPIRSTCGCLGQALDGEGLGFFIARNAALALIAVTLVIAGPRAWEPTVLSPLVALVLVGTLALSAAWSRRRSVAQVSGQMTGMLRP